MKVWYIAHTVTGLSFLLAIGSAIFLDPILITSLVSTAFIFNTSERIRRREKSSPLTGVKK